MRLKGFLILFISLFYTCSFAQSQGELTQSRILILLDESSSMIQKWPSGKEKYKAADELILHLMDSIYAINPDVEFSLRVFGHQHTVEENNCYDTKNEVPFSKDNRVQMSLRLDDIRPLGVTPISYALLQAAKFDLIDEDHNAYSIILITDGGESCGGDICEVMKKLRKYKVYFKPYIVSLEDDPTLKSTYSCMGDFLQVTKDADMARAVTTIVNAFRPAIRITKADYKQIQTMAANLPSALKVDLPGIVAEEHPDTNVIKKESEEIPLPKPKKIKDTVVVKETPKPQPKPDTVAAPKPVSKIKVDEAPVKPPAEKIAAIAATGRILLYTTVPFAKAPKTIPVTPVDIIVLPAAENISSAIPAQPIPGSTPAPAPVVLKTIPVPAVEIITKPEPEHMAGITPVSLKMVNYFLPPAKQMDFITPPPAPVIKVPVTLIPEKITGIPLSPLATVAVTNIASPKPVTMQLPPAPAIQVPITLIPETISHIPIMQQRPVAAVDLAPSKAQPRQVAPLPALVIDEPVVPKKTDKITRLQLREVRQYQNIFVIEDKGIYPRKVPPLPPLKIDIPKTTVSKTTTLPVNDPAPFKTAEFNIVREDAQETSLEVYITNGHGKFFTSTPQMLLLEPGTNKVLKTFYRTVDENGNPDPQTNLPAGTYNLALSAKRTLGVKNFSIEKNKKNKITVTVLPASLSFAYADAPQRPINEFVARVTERNKPQGRVQDQKCTSALEYDPGNYHIMINTFPQIDRNVDLDFEETIITIPQPGFVKFVHDDKLRIVVLYKQEGDKFLAFHTLDLNDAATQPLRIQPGAYQAHYNKGPGGPSASEKVVTFYVKATQETSVELN